ncbi:MAG: PASTA domain-containing protein [Elusimicrobiota bacterium]|jgi:beta-lactam-binding protein with PASTA domain|nr:PASTA domain-containing protein [Elusimicrobiota bacterium]
MRKKNRHITICVAIIIILVAIYFSFNFIMNTVIHSNKEIEVPNVEDKSLSEAAKILSAVGLASLKAGEESVLDKPEGYVIRQIPPPNVMVREGRVIRLTVSVKAKDALVPNLVGRPVRVAIGIIENINMQFDAFSEIVRRSSREIPKDFVLEQTPPAGSIVEVGQYVSLVLSDGLPLWMPDFVGVPFSQAQIWANREKMKIERIDVDDAGEPDTIVRQEPAADEDITKASSVVLYVTRAAVKEE